MDDADLASAFVAYTGPLTPGNVPEPAGVAAFVCALGAMTRRARRG
ncbi:MAG: hypothetical protein ACE37H_00240 [Phycisphaeraceae bacterium]